jgi:hypothetical protein
MPPLINRDIVVLTSFPSRQSFMNEQRQGYHCPASRPHRRVVGKLWNHPFDDYRWTNLERGADRSLSAARVSVSKDT